MSSLKRLNKVRCVLVQTVVADATSQEYAQLQQDPTYTVGLEGEDMFKWKVSMPGPVCSTRSPRD